MTTNTRTLSDICCELDELNAGDAEGAHSDADALLLEALRVVSPEAAEVADAYERVIARAAWWACA